ncbi:MAG: FtsW/RodA/SpoVE family cell cycle protein [Erysipelotrichaceae bacterium]
MNNNLSRVKQPKRFDFLLISIIVVMFLTSLIAIFSTFPLLPAYLSGPSLIIKQTMWFGVGFVVLAIIMFLGNDSIFDLAKIGYWILMVMLALLLMDRFVVFPLLNHHLPFITPINGATAWYQFLGFLSFQPSEFMKVILIIICAKVINDHNENKTESTFENDIILFKNILKWCIPPMLMILAQPDTGIVIIIAFSIALMVICSGIKKEWIMAGLILVGSVVIIFSILFFLYPDVLNDISNGGYKLKRFYGWIYPEQYIDDGRQLYTALLSLGTAGLTGAGLQNPVTTILEAQTDFIFAVFGQSFGFIGALWIIGLCLALDFKCYTIAQNSKNIFDKYIIVGVLGMLLFQQIQNICMIVGLLPVTGITLPLISYGGSSFLSYMLVFGIIMNTSANAKKLSDYVY